MVWSGNIDFDRPDRPSSMGIKFDKYDKDIFFFQNLMKNIPYKIALF